MAFFCVLMLEMSLILARRDPIYEDMASKFFEHFVFILDAINNVAGKCLLQCCLFHMFLTFS